MIKWSNILLLLTFVALSFSCSRSLTGKGKNVYTVGKSNKSSDAQEGDNRVIVEISKTDDKSNKSWLEIVEGVDSSGQIDKFDNPTSYKKDIGRFSAKEIQHPSISNYNPFDERGEMFFDMKRLKKEFHYPANGHLLSNYGPRGRGYHWGVDIKAEKGDNIYAAFDGVVRMSIYYGAYGNIIVIRHDNGLETVYSHNTKNLVVVGDRVSVGDVIAYAGRTGRATGYHVHFEVRVQGQIINPNLLINTTDKTLQDRDLYIYNRSGKVYATNNSTKKRKKAEVEAIENKIENPVVVIKESKEKDVVSASPRVHTVKKGDTLFKISKIYKMTVSELCKLNNIKESTILNLGRKLKVK